MHENTQHTQTTASFNLIHSCCRNASFFALPVSSSRCQLGFESFYF